MQCQRSVSSSLSMVTHEASSSESSLLSWNGKQVCALTTALYAVVGDSPSRLRKNKSVANRCPNFFRVVDHKAQPPMCDHGVRLT